MLQALNILENFDLKAMGYNSARYIHTLYQAMNLAFADRDFYYGDPYFPPEEPIRGLLSKEYARSARSRSTGSERPDVRPGDPYPFQGGTNPFRTSAREVAARAAAAARAGPRRATRRRRPRSAPSAFEEDPFYAGTTSVQAADARAGSCRSRRAAAGSPAVIAGTHRHRPEPADAELRARPGRQPLQRARAGQAAARHAHAELALKDGKPFLSFAVQGGDAGPEPAAVLPERRRVRDERAAGGRGGQHQQLPDAQQLRRPPSEPGRLLVHEQTPPWVRRSCGAWATASRRRHHLGADQRHLLRPRRTARCGAARATTARTTASPGERAKDRRRA
jgi:gamma-glutamyltranspeptidase / glutathione hydrolase